MKRGFTLVELVAVMSVITLLSLLVLPGVQKLRDYAALGQCAHNLKMLAAANAFYAAEHGHYVPAAPGITANDNLVRWHGARNSVTEAFDGGNGPLAPYLGYDRTVRHCGAFPNRKAPSHIDAFESSCGGYGYNDRGVGSQMYRYGYGAAASAKGMPPGHLANPTLTVMFADTAFPMPYGSPTHLIEYSFAEAYYHVSSSPGGGVQESWPAMPSIHFRHGGRANIVWSDGHVSAEKMQTEYNPTFTSFQIGWPGGPDNDLFRPF